MTPEILRPYHLLNLILRGLFVSVSLPSQPTGRLLLYPAELAAFLLITCHLCGPRQLQTPFPLPSSLHSETQADGTFLEHSLLGNTREDMAGQAFALT